MGKFYRGRRDSWLDCTVAMEVMVMVLSNTGGMNMLKNDSVLIAGGLALVWLAAYLFIGFDDNQKFLSEIGYVSAATVATSIITFFGILNFGSDKRSSFSDERLRSAIAASSTMTYLVLVGTAGLFTSGGQSPISQLLLTSFTATVGVIIAFYFGSSAYVAGKAKSKPPESDV